MYGRQNYNNGGGSGAWNDFQRFWRRSLTPATIVLIAVNIVTWLVSIFAGRALPIDLLAFAALGNHLPTLWSFVTWPLLGTGDPISLLFGCMWAFTFGGSLERSWGTRPFVLFFVAINALLALCVGLGAFLLHSDVVLAGLWAALAAPTVAWCIINRRESVSFFVASIPAQWVAYLAMILLWWRITQQSGSPVLGLFALIPCGAAWWYAQNGRYASFGPSGRFGGLRSPFDANRGNTPPSRPSAANRETLDSSGATGQAFNPLRWWRRRQENQKLEAMFRRSGFKDDEKKR